MSAAFAKMNYQKGMVGFRLRAAIAAAEVEVS